MALCNLVDIVKTSEPTVEPVTVAEAKEQLRLDGSLDDDLLTAYISAARAKAENYCNRFFAEATATMVFNSFPDGQNPFNLLRPDIQSIESITYRDVDNASTTLTGTITLDSTLQQCYYSTSWPDDERLVKVNLTMGVDHAASPVIFPIAVKRAILLYVSDLYEQRTTLTNMQVYENKAAESLLYPYRVNISA